MRIIQINATCGVGSTGKIAEGISRMLTADGIENEILCSAVTDGYEKSVSCASRGSVKVQALKAKLFGDYGFHSRGATERMIAEMERFCPDVVCLHNLHGHDVHLPTLFRYLKKKKISVVWVFHDCWAFTGYCTYFDFIGCDRWKSECRDCPQRKQFSWFFDRSRELFRRKKELFGALPMTVVTPSRWLAGLVAESFLGGVPTRVIPNGIDLSVFSPRESDFRASHGIAPDAFVILGVAFQWEELKGLDVFIALSRRLDAEKFRVVLVGTDEAVERLLPGEIVPIRRTRDQSELAEIYSAADLFFNPTREENYPTVNMEAIACGTPVLSFRTGGSPEMLTPRTGAVVERDDTDGAEREILRIASERPFRREDCVESAKLFDGQERFRAYCDLFRALKIQGQDSQKEEKR